MNLDFDITQGINFNLIVFFSTFIFSIIGTKLVILSLRNRITSPDIAVMTGKRKASTPSNGGIAMIFAIVCGFLAVEVNLLIIAAILLLAGIPILGNLMPIPHFIRLSLRVAAVALAISSIPSPIFSALFPPLFDKALAGFLWLWLIHSFDKLDVVEGLVPVQIASIGLGLGALLLLSDEFFSPLSIQAIIFACAGAGF
jgi:UDP-N-acetylmuramyl pentapeptide phosphotransferase/UDP-N-acetylglucosamine-1-phosphate transferase